MSTDDDSDDGYISTNALEGIRDGNYVRTYINARDAIFKIRDRIKKGQIEQKGEELSAKRMRKGLRKTFKAVIN